MIDVNIASDYSKLSNMLNTCKGGEKKEIIEKYSKYDEMQDIENLHKYTVIAVVDKIYVENIN